MKKQQQIGNKIPWSFSFAADNVFVGKMALGSSLIAEIDGMRWKRFITVDCLFFFALVSLHVAHGMDGIVIVGARANGIQNIYTVSDTVNELDDISARQNEFCFANEMIKPIVYGNKCMHTQTLT